MLAITGPPFEEWGDVPEDEIPPGVLETYFAAECSLPVLYGCDEGPPEDEGTAEEAVAEASSEIDPIMAQTCLVESGPMPAEGAPCPGTELGEFDRTETYYSSGFLGFEVDEDNTFELNLSATIAPGAYEFLCAVHGSFQSGTMTVMPADQPIPSPSEVNLQTSQQLNEVVEPFRQVYDAATEGQFVFGDEQFSGNFSGLMGARVEGLSGGAPEPPAMEGPPDIVDTDTPEPIVIDGGTRDGSGFWSSGVLFSDV